MMTLSKSDLSPRAQIYFGGDAQSWEIVTTEFGFEIHQVKNWRGHVVAAKSWAQSAAEAIEEFNGMAEDDDAENC